MHDLFAQLKSLVVWAIVLCLRHVIAWTWGLYLTFADLWISAVQRDFQKNSLSLPKVNSKKCCVTNTIDC